GKGQSAVFDALLFFIIMIIATFATMYFSSIKPAAEENMKRENAKEYCMNTLSVIMRSTISYAHYNTTAYKGEGNEFEFKDKPVQELLLEDIHIRLHGKNLNTTSLENDLEGKIKNIIKNLITEYHYYLQAKYGTATITITDSGYVSTNRYASEIYPTALDRSGDVTVTLYIWEA
ncbi:MAG: hypothetical protein AB1779_11395, partial [Candidatus Thermoplasmatota archaeon]